MIKISCIREVEDCEIENLVTHIPKLTDLEQNSLEGQITLEETGWALKNMKNGKSFVFVFVCFFAWIFLFTEFFLIKIPSIIYLNMNGIGL
jgi:hypothetical protein